MVEPVRSPSRPKTQATIYNPNENLARKSTHSSLPHLSPMRRSGPDSAPLDSLLSGLSLSSLPHLSPHTVARARWWGPACSGRARRRHAPGSGGPRAPARLGDGVLCAPAGLRSGDTAPTAGSGGGMARGRRIQRRRYVGSPLSPPPMAARRGDAGSGGGGTRGGNSGGGGAVRSKRARRWAPKWARWWAFIFLIF